MIGRRGFLGLLAGAATVASLPKLPTTESLVPVFPMGIAFHRDAFALVSPPITRMDILWGFSNVCPEMACRIMSDNDPSYRLKLLECKLDPARLPD